MKTWMTCFALVFGLVFGAWGSASADELSLAAPIADSSEAIKSTWEIKNRYCYSGAPVRDNFVMGRDTMELTFRDKSFRSFSDVQGCIGYSAGDYEINGQQITMFIDKQISTCSRERFVGVVTYPFQLTKDRLTITLGPIGYGGPCPQGDSLAVVYTRE